MDALITHRLYLAYTVSFHNLFPQLTMGLALLIVVLKTAALSTSGEHDNLAARFWIKIFAGQLRHRRRYGHSNWGSSLALSGRAS